MALAWGCGDRSPTLAAEAATGMAAEGRWYVSSWGGGASGRQWRLDDRPIEGPPGIYEVTQYPGIGATEAQMAAARDLRQASWEAAVTRGWLEHERGAADGYHRLPTLDFLHYVKEECLQDGLVLQPDRPEFLMYYETPNGPRLAGFMYYADSMYGHGPQIGGPLTVWHYHLDSTPMCWDQLVPVERVPSSGWCSRGVPEERTPEMIHVWFVDHPEGAFATSMALTPQLLKELGEDLYALPAGP